MVMSEAELAKHFIEYFSEGYEIFQEVPAYGVIDFVAKQGAINIAVEVKKNLNFQVIEQAFFNRSYCTYSYIAVPAVKSHHFGHKICQEYGIGVLEYRERGFMENRNVFEVVKPKITRPTRLFKLKLEDYMKQSVAGSQNNRVTAFGNTVNEMVKYIQRHPGCTLKNCLENIDFHWSSISAAKSSVRKWISNGVINEFKIENEILILNKIIK